MSFNPETVTAYESEFARVYGENRTNIKVKTDKGRFVGYAVAIDRSFPGVVLTENEMQEAIEQFRK